jgi:hypothetical protein
VTSNVLPIEIRRLTSADAAAYQMVRLAGLQEMPTAFAASYEEERGWSLSTYEQRLDAKADRGTFGAFDGPKLVGIVTLGRESMPKGEFQVNGTSVSRNMLCSCGAPSVLRNGSRGQ